MRRHSRASGKPARSRRPKSSKSKSRNPPKVAGSRSRRTGTETEVVQLRRELHEALEQRTAASEVLRVISSSPGELEPVFQAILANATRICNAKFGGLWMVENDGVRLSAIYGATPDFAEFMWRMPFIKPGPLSTVGRLLRTKKTAHVDDLAAGQAYLEKDPLVTATVDVGGGRTLVAVPMMKENEVVGAITIYRQEVQPFTPEQIELVQNFAAQAVIAIENARLLNELRERTDDLTERTAGLTDALEQQTATSEVLRVISSSPGDLQPVFAAMLENAVRICDAKFGTLYLKDGDCFSTAAHHNVPPAYKEARAGIVRPSRNTTIWRAANTKKPVQIADVTSEPAYLEGDTFMVSAVALGGYRSVLSVPMLHEAALVGVISIFRQEVRPFSERHVALVQNFAAQAVIAIENTRLLNELRKSLQRQTATSEVLQVISSSPGELLPVFKAIIANAVSMCAAKNATLWLYDDGEFQPVGRYKDDTGLGLSKTHPGPKTALGRMAATKQMVHIHDYSAEPAYAERDPVAVRAVEDRGIRTILNEPMLKEGKLVGAISIYRTEVRPFTQKQIELIANFAAQAVIAIENARLLKELRERTDERGEAQPTTRTTRRRSSW